MGKLYDEKSIESLSPLEFTRLRPGVYAGDCTYSTQLLVEIFSNSVDEYRWYIRRITRLQKIEQKIMTATGYVKLQTPLYEYVFQGSGLKDYYPVM